MISVLSVAWRCRSVALAIVLFLLVLTALPGGGHAADRPAYRLGAGDHLRVTVYEEKELTGEYDVSDQGIVTLPLIGPVQIGGHTLTEAEAIVTAKYGKDYLVNPHINVEVLNYRPFFILGEVKNPSSYPYVNGMTVVNAVALAGGYTPRANKSHITLKHGSDSAAEQEVPEDAPVLPGDVIKVPERFF
jgi:protein involved in polysaccharide export with SLBB domain